MKKLVMIVAAAFAVIAATPVLAQGVNTEGLTEAQQVELQAQAAKMREGQPVTVAKQASEWVEIGEAVGSGLAAAAEKTGQVVNDFAKTPVGQLTVAVIIYKVIGGDIIQLFIGLLFYAVALSIWWNSFKSITAPVVTIEYENGKKKSVVKEPQNWMSSETKQVIWAVHWIILLVIIVIGSMTIFM